MMWSTLGSMMIEVSQVNVVELFVTTLNSEQFASIICV